MLLDHEIKVTDDVLRPHTPQTEDDDARQPCARRRHQIREIKIVGEENRLLVSRFDENPGVRQRSETLFVEMARFMTKIPEVICGPRRDSHIEQESHAVGMAWTGKTFSSASQAA